MAKKHVLLAASATVVLWACGSDSPQANNAATEPPAPIDAPTAPSEESEVSEPDAPVEALSTVTDSEMVRSADAHVHGDASLSMALEGSTLTIEFDTPLYNLIGFEHVAETDDQKKAVEDAETHLNDPASLFSFGSEAGCVAQTDGLDIHLEHAHYDHGAHGHEAEKDNHEHDHEEHEGDHDDTHEDHDHDEVTHKDVLISYSFECASPDKLSPIRINLFERFVNLSELEVVYLGSNTQDLFSLTPTNTEINLRP